MMERRDWVRYGPPWLAVCSLMTSAIEDSTAKAQTSAPAVERSPETPRTPVASTKVTYPLRISSDSRYLVDQNQRPFFMVGDSAQSIYSMLSPTALSSYLTKRRSQGFNTLLAEPLHWDGERVMPSANGHLPFLGNTSKGQYDGTLGTADFDTPNPAYWDHVDWVLDQMQNQGFLTVQYVVSWGNEEFGLWKNFSRRMVPHGLQQTALWRDLEHTVSGSPQGSGLWKDLINSSNTEAVCYSFGQWLGRRYRNRQNILWLDGSDFNGDDTLIGPDRTSGITRSLAVLKGMQAAGALQLRSGDWAPETISTDEDAFAPYIDINGVYTYGPAFYGEARRGYQYSPTKPTYLKETGYEDENGIRGDPAGVRKYQWWTILSGAAAGLIYGHGKIWAFAPGLWEAALDSPGALDVQRMAALMNSVAWHNLIPSELAGMPRLVTSSNGSQDPAIPDYVAAAQTRDGTLLMAYVPPFLSGPQSVTVDVRAMRLPLRARWWDPTSADFITIGNHSNTEPTTFMTPGTNRSGSNDWVLILEHSGDRASAH
jgi:Protein of unknown function (DUF4038)/Putative collagen-binding domain of a collagenase